MKNTLLPTESTKKMENAKSPPTTLSTRRSNATKFDGVFSPQIDCAHATYIDFYRFIILIMIVLVPWYDKKILTQVNSNWYNYEKKKTIAGRRIEPISNFQSCHKNKGFVLLFNTKYSHTVNRLTRIIWNIFKNGYFGTRKRIIIFCKGRLWFQTRVLWGWHHQDVIQYQCSYPSFK